ncbi:MULTISPECIES: ATP-NAD kinase [unclassified Symbiopectobacterium]|uniref:ATP-NAD kinase n=1 Tax=unclassified Symbiopectobacterium TaxID=2794573 RepID=UPI002227CFE8|nr:MULTISPECIES: ATP-NAD kinase [unclassified Symbiopectobacterium]MCW2477761.1 ATP-NAD kinase [Candidatus Symbiopectobacterium sp. NZEC135]MCW2488886.1 ATP-NAD kinase [Candidatus Symbiopectobacterium sp. NZEC127]
MSDKIVPSKQAETAAYELLIELVRAQRVPVYQSNIDGLLKIYDQARKHFEKS